MVDSVNERRHGSIIPVILGTGAGVYIGGKVIGDPITAAHVLQQDTFELSQHAQAKLTTDKQKAAYIKVQEGVKSANSEVVSARLKEIFPENTSEKPAADYFKEIKEADVQSELNAAMAETPVKENAIKNAADKTAKKAAQDALASHNAKVDLIQSKLEIVKSGKITPETLKTYLSKELKLNAVPEVSEALKDLGKLPKAFAKGKAIIGAVGGLLAGLILSKITAPKNEA